MNHLDTFSGIGGWALAARWMGWNTLAFVEKEKFCHKVLNKNFPDVPIHDDIFTFSGKPFRGRVDILTGSTPCQPFSQAGQRKGSNDERHLFPEFLRVVAEVEPNWIVIENVYGLLSIESGQVFEDYHAQLESKGYSVQTVCIPASALNAPHRRDRLWIVAHTGGDGLGRRDQYEAGARQILPTGSVTNSNVDHSNADNARIGASRSQSNANRPPVSVQWEQSQFEPCGHSGNAADSDCERLQRGDERTNGTGQPEVCFGLRDWDEPWTQVAARFCRVDDVVPNRVDRLKSLGNAIVPQIAFELFRAIQEVENELSRS